MFSLSQKSLSILDMAHPDLVRVVKGAITITSIDFSVGETLRSPERQKQLVASGASETMNSRHLAGPDGHSRAVDLHAYVGGEIRWDWPLYYQIANAMRQASISESVPLEWGGCWDRRMSMLSSDMEFESSEYIHRRKSLGKKAFVDGPHFQLPISLYP